MNSVQVECVVLISCVLIWLSVASICVVDGVHLCVRVLCFCCVVWFVGCCCFKYIVCCVMCIDCVSHSLHLVHSLQSLH